MWQLCLLLFTHIRDSVPLQVYILLGVPTAEGDYSLTKYVLITWVGPSVKPKQRARSSPHRLLLYNEIDVSIYLHLLLLQWPAIFFPLSLSLSFSHSNLPLDLS